MSRRNAFSIAELVVAIGVLLLMFSLAGQVFNLTIQSTGQALAVTDVRSELRAFEQRLRADLRGIHRGESVMLIQGNPVDAYWTQDYRQGDADGDPKSDAQRTDLNGNYLAPRADILMFFTNTPARSVLYPTVTSNLQEVVYGHADTGDWMFDPSSKAYDIFQGNVAAFPSTAGYPTTATTSQVPAERWHLARRSVLLVPQPGFQPLATLNDTKLLQCDDDVYGSFDYERVVLRPAVPNPFDPQFNGDVYPYLPAIFDANDPFKIPASATLQFPFGRSQLDETPPAPKVPEALGDYLLPRCASFKVEWALDPRSEFVDGRLDGVREVIWFDPGADDPIAELNRLRNDPRYAGVISRNLTSLQKDPVFRENPLPNGQYSMESRFSGPKYGYPDKFWWGPDGRPNIAVFRASVPRQDINGKIRLVPDDIFPSVLRITVELYDSERRLDHPTRHVMVIPVGS